MSECSSERSSSEYDSEDEIDLLTTYLAGKAGEAAVAFGTPLYGKVPYHTSALSGDAWVRELIEGHPKRIRCELGVHLPVFKALIEELRAMGIGKSRNVTLREKLAIFLYKSVTGLSVEHVGERFQRSNDVVSG